MPAFFDLPSFFRRVSAPLLRQFFSNTEAFAALDWTTVSPRKIDPILQTFQNLTPAQRQVAFDVFRRAESLANSAGTRVLIEAVREKDSQVAEKLSAMRNAHDRALWMCIEHPDVIDKARTLVSIDLFSKRMFESRQGLPARQLEVTDEVKSALSNQIIEMLQPEQCRGEHCMVEHVRREGGVECFFAYPADYWRDWEGYDLDGNFERTRSKPSFKIVFAYHTGDGMLDIYSEGGARIRSRLAHLFARAVLGADQELKLPELACFDLDVLKTPNLTFPTNPVHRITLVRIQSMKLRFGGLNPASIEVAIDGRHREGSIHQVIADKLREPYADLGLATVESAVLQVFYQTESGKQRSFSFRLSAPSICNLEDSPEEQIVRGYLRPWGIEKYASSLATAA